jgi:integrase
MQFEHEAPGLKRRPRKNGTIKLYWVARTDLVRAGYEPETIPLPYDLTDKDQHPLIAAACMRYQAEMLEWSSGRKRQLNRFDGTLLSLSRKYQTDPASPFQRCKWNTREKDTYTLAIIEKAFGKRALAALKVGDFYRWYDEAKKPKVLGGPERIRKAHGIIAMLRRLFAYGVMAELAGCARLKAILDEARFQQPSRRRVRLEIHHLQAFVPKALEMNRLSLALGTAFQFETTMRQRDVIGEWAPLEPSEPDNGIVMNRRRWINGLTWADISDRLEVRKETTKTGAIVAHDLSYCPIVVGLLDKVPPKRRIGPLIIDEKAGRPYAGDAYGREWRIIARAAGIPDYIWNMDARAGGVSEADEAGADTDSIRAQTGHTQSSTTERYKRGGNIEKSRKVLELRIAYRNAKNGA